MTFEQLSASCVVALIGIEGRIERPGIDDQNNLSRAAAAAPQASSVHPQYLNDLEGVELGKLVSVGNGAG